MLQLPDPANTSVGCLPCIADVSVSGSRAAAAAAQQQQQDSSRSECIFSQQRQ
jgi:hypothetical protein